MRIKNMQREMTLVKTNFPNDVYIERWFDMNSGTLLLWERYASNSWGIDFPVVEAMLMTGGNQ